MNDVYILGIESSCDDTSAAVLRNGVLLSNVTASQEVHKAYGGVVPELASRAHQQNVVPVVDQALKRAGIEKEQLSAIAFTRGPGLMGSLLVGVSFAKGMARSLGIDTSTCTQFFHELRSEGFVQLFGDVAQSVLQCRSRLRRGKGVATVGCPPDTLDKGRIGRQCFT